MPADSQQPHEGNRDVSLPPSVGPAELPIDSDTAVEDAPRRRTGSRRWDIALVIAAGGAIGAAARYGLNQAWPTQPGAFPWATFTENVVGCLLIGTLIGGILGTLLIQRLSVKVVRGLIVATGLATVVRLLVA